ncbi:tRNA glutamyl-Q(34) synthetase GluQRS [Verticiella sediminum]|uniref:Glutamyl-Q tRNA(Asp) synthetase n=1 Tax=Verticiella sediminum TaxID=1247510 RepID=A0A556AYZ9_9BURK|nr:tRNA glutamyl-Q(34) synthetase GluQRS [Verticiella sediminum]TSH98162.1 tRNA glutamyl-Q(34) synthetase GluQRS [Verticiella sediminum]
MPVSARSAYVGRFAPSPSGPLHLGSLVAALASRLDALAHGGTWLVRIEDIDAPRTVAGADRVILAQLAALGMHSDRPVLYQSSRLAGYQHALDALAARVPVYPCGCTRREIAEAAPPSPITGERPYLGTCRQGLAPGRAPRAWRIRVPPGEICIDDRWLGRVCQDVAREVGDFVIRRADGLWAYQWVVVLDDIAQGITDIVRGADLLTSTARQCALYDMLGQPRPRYMHVPLVVAPDGRKLSKQNGAPPFDAGKPLEALMHAWEYLGFARFEAGGLDDFWPCATEAWARRWR